MIDDVQSAAKALTGGAELHERPLHLALGQCRLNVRSNSASLLEGLERYFAHVVAQLAVDPAEPDLDILAIERPEPDLGLPFIDWKREPGKSGRKDSYLDIPQGRLVRKVRTGMVFLQSEARRIAAGPCGRYDSQVINFINAQYMNWLQQRQWLICHAAGLVREGQALGIAGFSGGGKSTLMLELLEHESMSFLTNDRLFIRRLDQEVRALGIPKQPRINPGTIVNNPRLRSMIPLPERDRLLALPAAELWELEDKHDVLVEEVYGAGKVSAGAPLSAFLVLNWRRDSDAPVSVQRVDLAQRHDLLGAIMKSPGPFYQYPDGSFYRDDTALDADAYLPVLARVPIYEATGGIDFDALARRCLAGIMG